MEAVEGRVAAEARTFAQPMCYLITVADWSLRVAAVDAMPAAVRQVELVAVWLERKVRTGRVE